MAASTINIECKRFGCVKNLLACYGNCRYTGRCDELRNELADKTAAAESDINRYLSERGRTPILVQILKRGVKFAEHVDRPSRKPAKPVKPVKPIAAVVVAAKPRPQVRRAQLSAKQPLSPPALLKAKPVKSVGNANKASQVAVVKATSLIKRHKSRSRKRSTMPRKAKPLNRANVSANEGSAPLTMSTPTAHARPDVAARPSGERATPRKRAAAKPRKAGAAGKVYIIIEGHTASIVDEQGLMMHLFNNTSKTTRYFEANEVEARVQIVPKR
jgi:hypothetical protein